MRLVSLNPLMEEARRGHCAVGAFSSCNADIAEAIVESGCELRSPVMLIAAPCEIELLDDHAGVARRI